MLIQQSTYSKYTEQSVSFEISLKISIHQIARFHFKLQKFSCSAIFSINLSSSILKQLRLFVLIMLFWKIIFEHKPLDNNNKSVLNLILCQNLHFCCCLPLLKFIFVFIKQSTSRSDSVLLR